MKHDRPKTKLAEPPDGWQDDNLSRFITATNQNTYATFDAQPECWNFLARIEATLDYFINHIDDKAIPENVNLFLLFRMHAAYLSALRLFVATQYADTYPLLRSALEYGLYEFYLSHHPDKRGVWENRHASEEARKLSRSLSPSLMTKFLTECNAALGEEVKNLYDLTIDFGAHPNPQAVNASLRAVYTETGLKPQFEVITTIWNYWFGFTLEQCSWVGIALIEIMSSLVPEQADKLEITIQLTSLKEDSEGVLRSVFTRMKNRF